MELIGTKIQTLRKNKKITQAQLAEALSVSAQSVSKWENHVSVPDIALLPVIARYFGITMDELFNYRLDALNYKERFIRFLADNGVLLFGRFQLKSGRISPYVINSANYKSGSQITKLGEFYAECIREHNVEGTLLIGNTNREIPILIATDMVLYRKYGMDIPYCLDGAVGKKLMEKDKAVLIIDTLTSGSTLESYFQQLCPEVRHCITDVIVSVDRMEKGNHSVLSAKQEIERKYDVRIHGIVTLADIIRALERGVIGGAEYLEEVKEYQRKYGGESNGN